MSTTQVADEAVDSTPLTDVKGLGPSRAGDVPFDTVEAVFDVYVNTISDERTHWL